MTYLKIIASLTEIELILELHKMSFLFFFLQTFAYYLKLPPEMDIVTVTKQRQKENVHLKSHKLVKVCDSYKVQNPYKRCGQKSASSYR